MSIHDKSALEPQIEHQYDIQELTKENDRLRRENEVLTKLLEETSNQMGDSIVYWRTLYMAVAKLL